MPMYEYVCSKCQVRFEELVMSSSDEEALICPECSSGDVKKALSSFAISMGGGGQLPSCPSTGEPCPQGGGGRGGFS